MKGGLASLPSRAIGFLLFGLLCDPSSLRATHRESAEDLVAARRLFEANLDAIRRRDREAYLRCYLASETLARTGPEGPKIGFESLSKETSESAGWPDFFEGVDLQLVPVHPGLVYGTYRFRVRYGEEEQAGLSERLFVKTREGWRIAVTTAFPAPPGTPPSPRALVGATLVDGTGAAPVPDAVVSLRNGKIDCAGPRSKCVIPEGVEVTPLPGAWITPGLVDAHVHFSQTGWADGRPDALDLRELFPYDRVESDLRAHPERFLRADLCSGVTSVFDVGGYPWTWDLRRRAETDTRSPHVAAAGPLLSTRDFWLNLPAERQFLYLAKEEDAREGVRYLGSHGTDAVKIWFIVFPERDFDDMARAVLAAGEEARRLHLPLIVHATGLREAKVALKAGARLLVHSVGDMAVDDEFIRLARENKTIYCPTLTVLDGYRRLFRAALGGETAEVDDPNHCVDAGTLAHVAETARVGAGRVDRAGADRREAHFEAFAKIAPENLKRVFGAGIPVAMGTDAGNPLTLHGPSVYAEMEAMQAAGLSPRDVIVASTRNGANAMGRLEDLGTVEAGKAADLLILDGDPTQDVRNFRHVRYVVRGGVMRTIEELRAPREQKTP